MAAEGVSCLLKKSGGGSVSGKHFEKRTGLGRGRTKKEASKKEGCLNGFGAGLEWGWL